MTSISIRDLLPGDMFSYSDGTPGGQAIAIVLSVRRYRLSEYFIDYTLTIVPGKKILFSAPRQHDGTGIPNIELINR